MLEQWVRYISEIYNRGARSIQGIVFGGNFSNFLSGTYGFGKVNSVYYGNRKFQNNQYSRQQNFKNSLFRYVPIHIASRFQIQLVPRDWYVHSVGQHTSQLFDPVLYLKCSSIVWNSRTEKIRVQTRSKDRASVISYTNIAPWLSR